MPMFDITLVKMQDALEQIQSLLNEEMNVHPDILRVDSVVQPLYLTQNSAHYLTAHFSVIDRPNGRYLWMQIKDSLGTPVIVRQWKAVYRDPVSTRVVDKPNQGGS